MDWSEFITFVVRCLWQIPRALIEHNELSSSKDQQRNREIASLFSKELDNICYIIRGANWEWKNFAENVSTNFYKVDDFEKVARACEGPTSSKELHKTPLSCGCK